MTFGIIVTILSIVLMIASIIKGAKIKFWIFPLVASLLLIITNTINFKFVFDELTKASSINPIEILILFISMTFISVCLDELGFFKYLATLALTKAKHNQFALFFILYALSSILTVFTSNDIIILTFTPFIIFFCKNAKINPIPYLITEFVSANTWSMLFIIGNPTNIYLAQKANIDFFEYFKVMVLPTTVGALTSLVILVCMFYYQLKYKINEVNIEIYKIERKQEVIICLVILLSCIILLMVSNFIQIKMFIITLICAILTLITLVISKVVRKTEGSIIRCLKGCPYNLIPFVLSMFVLTLFLKEYKITEYFYNVLHSSNPSNNIINYGIASFLSCNLINNIPMSVLFSDIISYNTSSYNLFATIISSNIGAFLTPIGALAGIMWLNILKKNNIIFSFKDFMKYGIMISIPTLLISLMTLNMIL